MESEKQGGLEPSVVDVLRAILAVLVDQRDALAAERPGQPRTEVMLASAGLTHQTIAQLLGKNPDAVRMAIARAQAKANGGGGAKKKTSTHGSGASA